MCVRLPLIIVWGSRVAYPGGKGAPNPLTLLLLLCDFESDQDSDLLRCLLPLRLRESSRVCQVLIDWLFERLTVPHRLIDIEWEWDRECEIETLRLFVKLPN